MTAQKPTPAVYIVGSSGAGKSTLAKALAERLGWKYTPLSAGAAYARHNVTFDQAEADPEIMQRVQTDICKDAVATIETAVANGKPFVTDRAIDYAVYTALLCEPTVEAAWNTEFLKHFVTEKGATILFCRPVPEILTIARSGDAGRRSKFLTDEWVYRVDGAVLFMLRHRHIPFTEITAADRRERLDAATAAVMERLSGVKFTEFRADGWPSCPSCGEDELHNCPIWTGMDRPPLTDFIASGLTCYRCNWKLTAK